MNFRRSSSTNNLATPLGSVARLSRPSGIPGIAGRQRSSSTSGTNRPSIDAYKTAIAGGSVSKPFFGSSTKAARPSSVYGRAGNLSKDPRPLPNCPPEVRHRWANLLFEWLIENKYPGNITEAQLRQASNTRDVVNIFQFLYAFFEPNYKMEGKLEEEMPRTLKGLGYPVELKKSDFKTITTPNSWPNILAALVWMLELLKVAMNVDVVGILFPSGFDDESEVNVNSAVFELNVTGYHKFREGNVDFTDIDTNLENQLMSRLDSNGSVAKLRAENDRLQDLHKSLSSQRPKHEVLKETNEKMVIDHQSLQTYNVDMTAYNQQLQGMLDSAAIEQGNLAAEIPLIKQDIAEKEEKISRQELSPADVQRLVFSKQQLDSQTEKLLAEKEKREKAAFDMQCDMQKYTEMLRQKSAEFVDKSSVLLTLMGPEFLRMVDLKQFSVFDPKFEESFATTYKPGLLFCKKKCNEMVHEVRADIIEINKTTNQLEEELRANAVEVENLDHNIAGLQADRSALEEESRVQVELKRKELKDVKESYQQFLRSKLSGADETVCKRDKLMAQLDSVTIEMQKEMEVQWADLQEALQQFQQMEKFIEETEKELEQCRMKSLEEIRRLQDY